MRLLPDQHPVDRQFAHDHTDFFQWFWRRRRRWCCRFLVYTLFNLFKSLRFRRAFLIAFSKGFFQTFRRFVRSSFVDLRNKLNALDVFFVCRVNRCIQLHPAFSQNREQVLFRCLRIVIGIKRFAASVNGFSDCQRLVFGLRILTFAKAAFFRSAAGVFATSRTTGFAGFRSGALNCSAVRNWR